MTTDFKKLWHQAFDQCGIFARDTTLPDGLLEKYQVGLILKELTFCDSSHKIGGFVAPHRFLIVSSRAKCLNDMAPNPWGLCVFQRGTFFKVIDKVARHDRTQITLLDIPEPLLGLFARKEPTELEVAFSQEARRTFEGCVDTDPIPELNVKEWTERLTYPIGFDDQGDPFPLEVELRPQAKESLQFKFIGSPPNEPGDTIETADDIRMGDIVWFDRMEPSKLAMRKADSEDVDPARKKYRIERGDQPGVICLVEE